MTILFNDDFESGTLSKYTEVWGGSVQSAVVHAGIYAMQSSGAYQECIKTLASPVDDLFLELAVYFTGIPSAGGNVQFAIIYDTTNTHNLILAVYSYDGVTASYMIKIDDGAVQFVVGTPVTTNVWHLIKLERNVTGIINLWVDGANVFNQTGQAIVNPSQAIHIGEDYVSGSAITLYTDDVLVTDAVPTSYGQLSVTATQDGSAVAASVAVSNQAGTTPYTFTLPIGTYNVVATYGGQTQTKSATVVLNQTTPLDFAFTSTPPPAYIAVKASVGGTLVVASVTLDGLSGTTTTNDSAPLTFSVTAGTYNLSATYQGVTVGPQVVTVTAGQTTTVVLQFPVSRTLTINSATGGTTNPLAGTYTYADGVVVPIIALPITGYVFDHWILDGVTDGTSNPINVAMTADHTIIPVYVVQIVTLTILAGNGGFTTPIAGTNPYPYGTNVQVTATPDTGFKFSHWLLNGANAGATNPITINMIANNTLQPVFIQNTITLNVVAGANGTVSPSGVQNLVIGSTYEFVALPNTNPNYVLDHWNLAGANIGSTNPLSLTATTAMNNQTLTAIFAPYVTPPITMTIAVSPAEAGTTTPAVGQTQVTPGTIAQFTATRVVGWDFVQWELGGAVYSNNPLSLPIVQSMDGQTLTAVFTRGKVSVTVSATVGGTVNPTGTQILTIGQSYNYSATASTSYVFDHWELGGVNVSASNPYSLVATLDMDGKTLLAVFVPAKISLTVLAGANGSVNPSGLQTLTVGTKYFFGAFPNSPYKLKNWDLAGANLGSTNPLELTATIDMDGQVLTAFFLPQETPQITMVVAVTPSGAGSTNPPLGSNTFNIGDLVQFTATPIGEYAFVQWTLDGMTFTDNPLALPITQNMQGATLTAVLAIPQVTITVTADVNGSVSPSGTQILVAGHSYQFAAVGASGYVLDHWELGGNDLGSANPITLTPTTANEGQSLVAFFKLGVVEAGFPWWALLIVIPTAAGFSYYMGKPSKKRRR